MAPNKETQNADKLRSLRLAIRMLIKGETNSRDAISDRYVGQSLILRPTLYRKSHPDRAVSRGGQNMAGY